VPLNAQAPQRFLAVAALLVDAVAAYQLYRGMYFVPPEQQPVLAPTALALMVAGVAIVVALRPGARALRWARGIALMALVPLAAITLLWWLAFFFESGPPNKDIPGTIALVLIALAVQVAVFAGTRAVDGLGPIESFGSAVSGAVGFLLVSTPLCGVLSLIE
jgi:hypothetical protein